MTDARTARYLTIRVIYPKPEHRGDVLAAVGKVAAAAHQFPGLVEIGAWLDEDNDRLVNISLWESQEQALEATRAMHPKFSGIPWTEWERQPAENFLGLTRVV